MAWHGDAAAAAAEAHARVVQSPSPAPPETRAPRREIIGRSSAPAVDDPFSQPSLTRGPLFGRFRAPAPPPLLLPCTYTYVFAALQRPVWTKVAGSHAPDLAVYPQ